MGLDQRTKDSLVRRFGDAFDVIEDALRECPEVHWSSSLWPVDPHDIWINEVWFWAHEQDVAVWRTDGAAVGPIHTGARKAISAGFNPRDALEMAVSAAGVIMPVGVEPPPVRTDEAVQVYSAFYRVGFHALFHCDMRLSDPDATFVPPPPFTIEDEDDILIHRVHQRQDLLAYVGHCREKVTATITALVEADAVPRISHWSTGSPTGALRKGITHLEEHGRQMRRGVAKWTKTV